LKDFFCTLSVPCPLVQEVDFTGGEPLLHPEWMKIASYVKKLGIKTRILSNGLGYYSEFCDPEFSWSGCAAGILACGITSDGKIKGCLSLPDEFVEGDLRKNDLWDIWFHPDFFPYSRNYSKDNMGPNCISCDKVDKCHGGCSIMSYGYTGRFNNDPYCFYRIKKEI
jgi:radical SAM protein with 4Fe4S-binding SPASM domain